MSFIIKPYILIKDIEYSMKEITRSLLFCLRKISILSVPVGTLYVMIPQEDSFDSIMLVVLSFMAISIILFLMMPKRRRKYVLNMIRLRRNDANK